MVLGASASSYSLLLLGVIGSEAISFKAFRSVHVAEDDWTKTDNPDHVQAYSG